MLFNLAEAQNDCGKKFKLKPEETLDIIQNLYEKKLVTYPRTDARVLSTAVAKEISKNLNGLAKNFQDGEFKTYINEMKDNEYTSKLLKSQLLKSKYVDDSKITDHYAIIPTGQGFENYDSLSELHKEVYKTIARRFLAIFFEPAEYSKISVTVNIENETFNSSGKVCLNRGYLDILKPQKQKEKQQENMGEEEKNKEGQNVNLDILKNLKKGQEIDINNLEIKDSETTPPSRYTSSSMILAMENAGKLIEDEELREQIKGAGIGTSATRGGIIEKLERIKYMQINSKTMVITPTKKGEAIYDVIKSSMPDMLNPKLTASWEKGLDMVAKSEINPEKFMDKLEEYINSKFNKLVVKY